MVEETEGVEGGDSGGGSGGWCSGQGSGVGSGGKSEGKSGRGSGRNIWYIPVQQMEVRMYVSGERCVVGTDGRTKEVDWYINSVHRLQDPSRWDRTYT
jgi:hypothetical protein